MSPMASVPRLDHGAPSPLPGADVLAEGALAQLGAMHARLEEAVAQAERQLPLSQRLRRGWRRARRNGARVHLYPAAFSRGYRSVRRHAVAKADLRTLAELVAEGRYAEATALGTALLPERGDDAEFLDTALEAFTRTGALTSQIAAVRAKRARADTATLARQEAKLVGKLHELEPAWLPDVPTPAAPPAAEPGRVLHLLKVSMPYRQSGYTMRSHYVIESQRAVGLEPVGVTALGFPEGEEAPRTEIVDGTTFHRLPAPKNVVTGLPDVYLEKYATAVAERMPEIRPSVIHAHSGHRGFETAVVALALGRAYDVPVVYEVRGFFESLWSGDTAWNERGETYARRIARETWCMNQADAVVTLSESMKADIVARGVPADKVAVVPNGVNTDQFHPRERSTALVERWGLQDSFVFGYVSNLDHRREGHELLVRAAARLRERGVPAVAMIIGDGRRRAELERIAADEGVEGSVIFTGKVPHTEVLDYYRLLDVFVVPRIDERAARLVTPLKPFEAMAAQVPVVVSDLPALQEITGDGERGWSFRTGDADSLADALAALHADPGGRDTLAGRGRDWVVAERQWVSNGRRYADLYERIRPAGA